MRHVIVLLLLGIGIYYFGFRESELDRLLKPAPPVAASTPRDIFVEPDYRSAPIDDKQYRVAGQYTIIYYHWEQCPGCRRLDSDLARFLDLRKDVVVRKIQLANNWSVAGAQRDFGRNIGITPFVVIFGPNNKLIVKDEGTDRRGVQLLYEWMNVEFQKDGEAKNKKLQSTRPAVSFHRVV